MAGGLLGTVSGQVRLDIRQAVAAYATLRAQNARTVYALRGTGDAFVAAGQKMTVAGLALVAVFGYAVKRAADFEKKMDFFAAVSDTSAESMQRLSKFTLQLATDTIYSADQIAEGFIELGKAGVTAEQIMAGIGEAMANLGAAGDIPLAESGQIITSTIQQFDLAARDAVEVTDLLAGAANASIADITDIGVSLKYVGGVANAVGLTFEDTATAISLLAKAGIRGSTAGTSLRQMIVSLGGATEPARKVLKELGIITEDGSNKFFTQEGRLKSLAQVYQILQNQTKGLTQKERLMALRTIFNNRALSAASILTREGAKGFKEMNKEMAKTTAADVAAERLDNLSGDIEILRGNIDTLFIQGGTPFQEMLRGWTQQITKAVQAFGKLSPETQKTIFSVIGISGAVLVAMGLFTTAIGMVFRFVAAMLKLAAGFKFLFRIIKIVVVNFRWLMVALGISLGPIGWIVIAVLALAAAFVIAYKKSETFRNFVNKAAAGFMKNVVTPLVDGIKQIIEWFKLLVKDPEAAWEQLKDMLARGVVALGNLMDKVPEHVNRGLDIAIDYMIKFGSKAADQFVKMATRIIGIVVAWIGQMIDSITLDDIVTAIEFVVVEGVKAFIKFRILMLQLTIKLIIGLLKLFRALSPKLLYLLGFLIGAAIGLWVRWNSKMAQLAAQLVLRVLKFFAQLPPRAFKYIQQLQARFIMGLVRLLAAAIRYGPAIVLGIIRYLGQLPGKVFNLMVRTVSSVVRNRGKIAKAAVDFGLAINEGVMGFISGLPGAVWGILGAVISAFNSMVKSAFNSAKSFAGGLWKGFKSGLGMKSPSLIEKQMWTMTRVVGEETKKMNAETKNIQKMSGRLAKVNLADKMSTLHTMSASDRMRARMSEAAVARIQGKTGQDRAIKGDDKPKTLKIVKGQLSIDASGRAFIRGVAEEVVDENDHAEAMARRRRL